MQESVVVDHPVPRSCCVEHVSWELVVSKLVESQVKRGIEPAKESTGRRFAVASGLRRRSLHTASWCRVCETLGIRLVIHPAGNTIPYSPLMNTPDHADSHTTLISYTGAHGTDSTRP